MTICLRYLTQHTYTICQLRRVVQFNWWMKQEFKGDNRFIRLFVRKLSYLQTSLPFKDKQP